ncbi:MAG TPA: hypothetical protein PLK94_07715 [Alphaproteobacteria bacterium]|nr:hypothetical protein [Alphaproteobacteria bacterium]HOO51154.1 hypothetical protein [Alphaproteobacteria bacterium]
MNLNGSELQAGDAVFAQLGGDVTFVNADPVVDNSGRLLPHAVDVSAARWGGDLKIENCNSGLPNSFASACARPVDGGFVGHSPAQTFDFSACKL